MKAYSPLKIHESSREKSANNSFYDRNNFMESVSRNLSERKLIAAVPLATGAPCRSVTHV